MVCRDADGNYIELTEAENADLKTAHRTAEMIYEAKKAEGDYHDSMDSSTYLAWRSFVFSSTLRALYPGKRIIAIKDDDDVEWRCPPCLLPVPRSPSKKKRSGRGLGPVTSPRKRRKPAKFADQGE